MLTMEEIIVSPPADDAIVDPRAWFESPGPLEIEIGCGKGGFLLNRARANPHRRLLGIEWAGKYFRYCADRMARWNVSNVRVMRTDARHFVINHLPPKCVSVLHVYHPDPWPKKRHHKRRLIQPDFVRAAADAMEPGGLWLLQTDHLEYFGVIRGLLESEPALRPVDSDSEMPQPSEGWGGTNFEIKYAREGRAIHRVAFERC